VPSHKSGQKEIKKAAAFEWKSFAADKGQKQTKEGYS
jgi:hypothetical protein